MKKIFKEIKRLPEFEKDLKRLKRFRTLEDDLNTFIEKQLKLYHKLGVDNKGIFRISNLGIDNPEIFKACKFSCKSLKGKGAASGIRIIYAFFKDEDVVEFVEIYYKGDKAVENKARILNQYKK